MTSWTTTPAITSRTLKNVDHPVVKSRVNIKIWKEKHRILYATEREGKACLSSGAFDKKPTFIKDNAESLGTDTRWIRRWNTNYPCTPFLGIMRYENRRNDTSAMFSLLLFFGRAVLERKEVMFTMYYGTFLFNSFENVLTFMLNREQDSHLKNTLLSGISTSLLTVCIRYSLLTMRNLLSIHLYCKACKSPPRIRKLTNIPTER